jgi:hypothetical protein
MRLRRVTLLVLVYAALDFSNPLMPGAVQLVGGALETVVGCQARSSEAPASAVAVISGCPSTLAPQPEPTRRSPGRIVSVSPPVPAPFRASLEPRSAAPSSSDGD